MVSEQINFGINKSIVLFLNVTFYYIEKKQMKLANKPSDSCRDHQVTNKQNLALRNGNCVSMFT